MGGRPDLVGDPELLLKLLTRVCCVPAFEGAGLLLLDIAAFADASILRNCDVDKFCSDRTGERF